MQCKKCGGELIRVEDTVVQCKKCLTKYRVKAKSEVNNVSNEDTKKKDTVKKEKVVIDTTKPFSSQKEKEYADKLLKTIDEQKSLNLEDLIDKNIELEIIDYQNAQDVNDAIKDYEYDIYPETRPMIENIKCSNCNQIVDMKTGICPNCKTQMALPEKKILECPFCHHTGNNIYSEFCMNCKRDLDPERERLGIKLKEREHKPLQNQTKKKDSDNKDNNKMKKSQLIAMIFSIILSIVMLVVFFKVDLFSEGGVNLSLTDVLDIIKNLNSDSLVEKLNSYGFGLASEFFAKNNIIFQIGTIGVLGVLISLIFNIVTNLFLMLFKNKISSSSTIVGTITFISSLVLIVFVELVAFNFVSALLFAPLSPFIIFGLSLLNLFTLYMM